MSILYKLTKAIKNLQEFNRDHMLIMTEFKLEVNTTLKSINEIALRPDSYIESGIYLNLLKCELLDHKGIRLSAGMEDYECHGYHAQRRLQ